ncbi:MAG: redox-regulated ATPase YchF [Rickettsiaceae bacterium]|nr:redox-regulated ATPase YchF [Rickettsiaceae bacterium]
MGLKCGIVGLPNVGKSTLFNALTATQAAEAANYPFCTIEPNSGIVDVHDDRLNNLSKIAGSKQIIYAKMEFVDIAGLVKGASKGEGLGNKFLSHIREVDAIVHVVRCFDDENITHVHNKVDPLYDIDIIETELILADLETIEKLAKNIAKKNKQQTDVGFTELDVALVREALANGVPARTLKHKIEKDALKAMQIITSKPVLYVCNVTETNLLQGNNYTKSVQEKAEREGAKAVIICAKIEEEIAQLETVEERIEFLKHLGLNKTGLSKIIGESYSLLDLKSYFTVGPKEARAWTFKDGATAPEAAGIIHTDFQRGFIKAEVISSADFINLGGEARARETGKLRLEGKDYLVQDGDVIHFKFNV